MNKPYHRFVLTIIAPLILCASAIAEETKAALPPIEAIAAPKPSKVPKDEVNEKKPLVITSLEQATKHFTDEDLDELKKKVDFTKQQLLIFAWSGSGQDKITYDVGESDPEQIFFTYQPGRTRDLRPHLYVYVLRSNVKWSVK